ncbi:MAG: CDP-glycerol glycerophosphotransferase family protein [Eubacterium sp.]|nr:CDP-glycerol glycerophosphotransferase family protein [Eubacterium sp.]
MILQKFTSSDLVAIRNKTICCVEKSQSYMKELFARFDLSAHSILVVDSNKRNRGAFVCAGREIEVFDLDYLKKVDWRDTALLITSDYYREAYEKVEAVLAAGVLEKTDTVDSDITKPNSLIVYYFANQETEYEEYYRGMYEECPLENKIIFRSGPHASAYIKGMDFSDNARALFEYMLAHGYNEKYELIWLVKNPAEFVQHKAKNVRFLSFDWSVSSDEDERNAYYEVLCLAKYIFFTDAYGFARNCRSDQIRIQLWHGCGYKTRVNFSRCEKRYEYMTVISDAYAEVYAGAFGLRRDQMLVTGYAKQDWLFYPIKDMCETIGIPRFDKYIFWLPTFRMAKKGLNNLNEYSFDNQTGLPIVGTFEELGALNDILEKNNVGLVVKLHPFQDKSKISEINMSNIVMINNDILVEKDIQINQLLGNADALISDYSSVAVDYMLCSRPIAFTLDDVEEYENSRGFFFDDIHEWLPGKEVYDFNDFLVFIQEVIDGVDSTENKRKRLQAKMHKYGDDKSSQRILEALNV